MRIQAYSILDNGTGAFGAPFFMTHPAELYRAVIEVGMDLATVIGRHPGDFSVYEVGKFDNEAGTFVHEPPRCLGTVLSMLPRPKEQGGIDRTLPHGVVIEQLRKGA